MIQLSPAAHEEIQRLQATPFNRDRSLHLSLQVGGCLALTYELQFVLNSASEQRGQAFQLLDCQGIPIWVETAHWAELQGLAIDYSEDLMGGGFRFHHPQALKVCNCGNSFAI